MATYTLNTTVAQEAVLTRIRTEKELNTDGTPKYLNNGVMLLGFLTNWFMSWKRSFNIESVGLIKLALDDKWDDITEDQRNQIRNILDV